MSLAKFSFECVDGPLDREDLLEDVDVVSFLFHHPGDPPNLPLDPSQPIHDLLSSDHRSSLLGWWLNIGRDDYFHLHFIRVIGGDVDVALHWSFVGMGSGVITDEQFAFTAGADNLG